MSTFVSEASVEGTVHRSRHNLRLAIGVTACGIRFTLDDGRYDERGEFNEEYCTWRSKRAGNKPFKRCRYCQELKPLWHSPGSLRRVVQSILFSPEPSWQHVQEEIRLMATATKERKPRAKRTNGHAHETNGHVGETNGTAPLLDSPHGNGRGYLVQHRDEVRFDILRVDQIDPSPHNPRTDFDAQKLQDLAATIQTHGLLEPLLVRPGKKAGRYELVAGERRYRAAKLAGLVEVPCTVRQLNDREAKIVQAMENLQREDLNAIDEARGFLLLTTPEEEGGGGYTQTELAERLKVSQPHIANRLRLLKLPANWQSKIISGEIPASHARELVPLADLPELMQQVETTWARETQGRGALPLTDFRELLGVAASRVGGAMSGREWDKQSGTWLGWSIELTPELRGQLDVRDVPDTYAPDVTEPLAFDRAAWVREKAAAIARAKAAAAKKQNKQGGKEAARPKQRTPAQEKARKAEQARQHAQRVQSFALDWQRYLCWQKLGEKPSTLSERQRRAPTLLLLYAAVELGQGVGDTHGERAACRRAANDALEHALKQHEARYGHDVIGALTATDEAKWNDIALEWLRGLLFDAAQQAPRNRRLQDEEPGRRPPGGRGQPQANARLPGRREAGPASRVEGPGEEETSMKSDQVIGALGAALCGDRERTLSIMRQMEAAGNGHIANSLRDLLGHHSNRMIELESPCDELRAVQPNRELDDLLLPVDVAASIRRISVERQCSQALAAQGLQPRNKLLFSGPPGNGKTATAEALATLLAASALGPGASTRPVSRSWGGKLMDLARELVLAGADLQASA